MRSQDYDVVALGRACVDEILEVDAYPPEDTKAPVRARLREGGGQASTAACLAAHLGGRAAFLGVLGPDEPGRFARARMEAFGVDLSFCPPPRGNTPLAYCMVSRARGTRTILYEPSRSEPLRLDEIPLSLLDRTAVLLVDPQAEHLIPRLAERCRERGVVLVADAEHARPGWEDTWARVDVLAMGGSFLAEVLPGGGAESALAHVASCSSGTCVATLGDRGAIAWLGGRVRRFPPPQVPVRDSTGAGDAFHGALALALAGGAPVPAAVAWAVEIASLACRGLGGRSFPDTEKVPPLPGRSPSGS